MQNYDNNNNSAHDYRGKRALMLLRVSTPEQEKGFGWPAQEREIRRKLIEPLALKLDEKHIIRDTYTGLEFRERAALDCILEMARRREFDILVTDVLDRLGRKGLARELYRMQLRELGVRILTTDPDDHADDDILIGEMIRLIKGYQAEEELNNTRRRTMNGKRAKAEGLQKDGTIGERKIVGNHIRPYGYNYTYSEEGRVDGLEPRTDVIFVEEDGTEWTEVKVVIFIFESSAAGLTLRQIALVLNEKGIPSPSITKGVKYKKERKRLVWQPSTIQKLLKQSAFWGEFRQFKWVMGDKIPGRKQKQRLHVPEEEQIVISVPALVSKELAGIVQRKLQQNKELAARHNPDPTDTLLRSGLVKCGHCGNKMSVRRTYRKDGSAYLQYHCSKGTYPFGKCVPNSHVVKPVDIAAWEKALEIVRDPSQVNRKLDALKSDDPTADRRKHINNQLAKVRKQQTSFREQLASMMLKDEVDKGTIEFLQSQLKQLADQEEGWKRELAADEYTYNQWKLIQDKVEKLYEVCADMREQLRDPNYNPSYQVKRDLLEFLGIRAIIWKHGNTPRFEIQCNPPEIMSIISQSVLWPGMIRGE